ncbi:MAG TPA: MFS transporter [Thermotogota bacterium]|nr:MFS transporter [Thermotogota bacterium]HRW92908.1 MFS transporter [Thermotogota bacterium]
MHKSARHLLLYTIVTAFANNIFNVILNLFLREINLTNGQIGNITSAQLWGAAILGLLVSTLADMFGRRRILLLSSVVIPLFSILLVFQKEMPALLVLSFLRGGFLVVSFTVVQALMVTLSETRHRAKLFGLNMGLMMGSGVLGNFLGGWMGDTLGLQPTLVVSMVLFFVSFFPLLRIQAVEPVRRLKHVFDFSGFSLGQKRILFFHYMTTVTVGFGAGLFIHFGNLIFKDLFDMSATGIGIALSVAQLGTAFGNSFAHRLGNRFGPLEFRLLTQALVVPLMVGLVLVRNPFVFTVLYALRFVLMNTATPIFASIVNSSIPSESISTISGINSFLNNAVRGVAAMLFGFIVGASIEGYNLLFSISTVFYGANVLIAFFILKLYRDDPVVQSLFTKRAGKSGRSSRG